MTPLVFLPGMMCDARLFAPQIAALSLDRTVTSLPIHAHSTVQNLALDVLDKAPASFALSGLSMGGIVAMEVMRQAPDRVKGVALMDTNPKAEAPKIAEARQRQIERVRQGELASVMRDEMKPNYLADSKTHTTILGLCMKMALDLGPHAFENQSLALASRLDQQDTLRSYTDPCLILCGAEDALCPIHRHTLMQELMPHAALEIIAGAGHLPTLEQPNQTTAAMNAWLREI